MIRKSASSPIWPITSDPNPSTRSEGVYILNSRHVLNPNEESQYTALPLVEMEVKLSNSEFNLPLSKQHFESFRNSIRATPCLFTSVSKVPLCLMISTSSTKSFKLAIQLLVLTSFSTYYITVINISNVPFWGFL